MLISIAELDSKNTFAIGCPCDSRAFHLAGMATIGCQPDRWAFISINHPDVSIITVPAFCFSVTHYRYPAPIRRPGWIAVNKNADG
ncbi:MAG: hypothetical protein M9934_08580 [Thermomicrobiales bacterium]|nr:hypothetical protein [Thermomicrobiales bacterium]